MVLLLKAPEPVMLFVGAPKASGGFGRGLGFY